MKPCFMCGKKTKLGARIQTASFVVCFDCLINSGVDPFSFELASKMQKDDVQRLLSKRDGITDRFVSTDSVDGFVRIDEKNRLVQIIAPHNYQSQLSKPMNPIIHIDEIAAFDVVEDGITKTSDGLTAALVGGLLFGATGAVIGASAANRESKHYCDSLNLVIVLKDSFRKSIIVEFLSSSVSYSSPEYVEANKTAERCLQLLQKVTANKNTNSIHVIDNCDSPNFSVADEIMKLKQLFDVGAITQDEFDTQKKKLLNL